MIAQTALLGLFVLLAIWLYGSIIASRLTDQPAKARMVTWRFRIFAALLAIACFIVGLLYRGHVISLTVAAILYIPEAIGFIVGLWLLQPYLRQRKEDDNHE